MYWHTVNDWPVDVVVLSETRLTATNQWVIGARAHESGGQTFGEPLLDSCGGGGVPVRCAIPVRQTLPSKIAHEDGAADGGSSNGKYTNVWGMFPLGSR